MVDSTITAESLVCRYLNGQNMDAAMCAALVWVAAKRFDEGLLPTLSASLCQDIGSQAVTPPPIPEPRKVMHTFLEPGPTWWIQ